MQQSMLAAISALRSHQSFMDVVANNIANVNTPAYKQNRISFLDMLSQTYSRGGGPTDTLGGVNPVQIGLGMRTGSIDTIFTQGALQATGRPADLAIQGDGFFVLVDQNGNTLGYTRDGSFGLDAEGYLVHLTTGYYVADTNGGRIQVLDPTVTGDDAIISWQVNTDGTIVAIQADGDLVDPPPGIVGLVRFANPSGLLRDGQNLYQVSLNSGDPLPNGVGGSPGQPGADGLGVLRAGFLERSNVDLAKNLTDMIIAQRGFQVNSRIVTASDQMLQDLVNLGRR